MRKLSIILTYLLVFVATAIFLAVAIPKILFPFEGQWLEGAMLTEISWVLDGKLLYCPPSIYHVSSLYQPLYFYVSAGITSITGLSYTAARVPSILATVATVSIIYFVVKKETGKVFFAISAVGLYIGAYAKTEFSFVAARVDPLLTVLIVAAVVVIYYSKTYPTLLIGVLLFVLSFFTKQSSLVFIPPISLYLLFVRDWKHALFFTCAVFGITLLGIVSLNIYYNGWYTFYIFSILKSMSGLVRWRYAVDGFVFYIFLRCWLISMLLLIFTFRSFFTKSERMQDRASVYFGLFFATGIIAGFLGILNSGGGHNVLLQAATGCALFLPILANEFSLKRRFTNFALWLIPIQLIFLISNPWHDQRNIVMDTDKDNYKKFYEDVASLPGEIWIPFHGFTNQYTGKNDYAVFDCLKGALLPQDSRAQNLRYSLDTAFENRHWSYILSDIMKIFPHYQLAGTMKNYNKVHLSDDTLLYIYRPDH